MIRLSQLIALLFTSMLLANCQGNKTMKSNGGISLVIEVDEQDASPEKILEDLNIIKTRLGYLTTAFDVKRFGNDETYKIAIAGEDDFDLFEWLVTAKGEFEIMSTVNATELVDVYGKLKKMIPDRIAHQILYPDSMMDSFDNTSFLEVLRPPIDEQNQLQPGPVFGYAFEYHMAAIDSLLDSLKIENILPSETKLLWALSPVEGYTYSLIATKRDDPLYRIDKEGIEKCRVSTLKDGLNAFNGVLKPEYTPRLKQQSTMNIGRSIAVVLDNRVLSYPSVVAPILNGSFSMEGPLEIPELMALSAILENNVLHYSYSIVKSQKMGSQP